jgi:hypothetical protein
MVRQSCPDHDHFGNVIFKSKSFISDSERKVPSPIAPQDLHTEEEPFPRCVLASFFLLIIATDMACLDELASTCNSPTRLIAASLFGASALQPPRVGYPPAKAGTHMLVSDLQARK